MVLSYPAKKDENNDIPDIWTIKPRPEVWSRNFMRFYGRVFYQFTFSDCDLRQRLPAALAGGRRCGVCERLLLNPGPACLECHPYFRRYIFYLYGNAVDDFQLPDDFGIDRVENYIYAVRVIRKYFLLRWPTAKRYRKYFRRFYTQEELPDYVIAGSEGLQPHWISEYTDPAGDMPRIRPAQPNPGGPLQEYPARSSSEPVTPFKLKWTVSQVKREEPDVNICPDPGQVIRDPDDIIACETPGVTGPDNPVPEPKEVIAAPDSGRELPETVMLTDSIESTETEQSEQLQNPKTVVYRFGERLKRLIRERTGPRKVVMVRGEAERGSDTWIRRLLFVAAGSPREFPRVNWNPG